MPRGTSSRTGGAANVDESVGGAAHHHGGSPRPGPGLPDGLGSGVGPEGQPTGGKAQMGRRDLCRSTAEARR